MLGAESERELVVLTDGELLSALAERSRSRLTLVDTVGRGYSPWPRDAMTFARTESGDLIALLRPNRQPGREHDSEMGLLFVAGMSDPIDRALGAPRWSIAPVPFHNGQILWTPGVTWVSGHTLERRALELLGLDRVPVGSFATSRGLDAYLGALDRAAGELEVLYRQPVRFVHTVPRSGTLEERQNGIWRFGGGAGFDDFLLGWNNAVLVHGETWRAEAFATPVAAGDELARRSYAAAGYRLDLVPPLRGSVLHNGGYRCASNHVRLDPGARSSATQ